MNRDYVFVVYDPKNAICPPRLTFWATTTIPGYEDIWSVRVELTKILNKNEIIITKACFLSNRIDVTTLKHGTKLILKRGTLDLGELIIINPTYHSLSECIDNDFLKEPLSPVRTWKS